MTKMTSRDKVAISGALAVAVLIVMWPVLAIATGLLTWPLAIASQWAAIGLVALAGRALKRRRPSDPG